MANITEYLAKILSARYGKDVRQSIHDSIDAINKEVVSNNNDIAELTSRANEASPGIVNTASGERIFLVDGSTQPLMGLNLYGKSEKKYSKNLLKNEVLSQTIGNLTITRNADGSLTFNGTVTEAVILDFLAEISEAGTYYTSGCPIADTNCIVMTTTPNGVVTPTRGSTDEITLDITASGTLKYVLTLRTGLVLDNVTWYPMVSTESGATYVPYECNIVSATENGYLGVGVTDGSLTLVSQTSRVDAPLGEMCEFSVDVVGEGLTYQWEFVADNGQWTNSTQPGYNTDTLTLEMQERRDGQRYRCTIIDANSNIIISNTATMNLDDEYKEEKTFVMKSAGKTQSMNVFVGSPRLIMQSGDFVGVVNKQSSIGVTAEGDGLTYQWYYKRTDMDDFVLWTNKTASTLSFVVYGDYNQAKFYCEITDTNGNMVTSDIITLTLGAVASGTYKIINRTPFRLAGVPVDSDGNYTDENGQQYICDEIDYENGKYVKRIHKVVFDGSDDEKWTLDGTNSVGVNNFKITIKPYQDKTKTAFFICNNLTVQTTLIGVTQTEGIIMSTVNNGACYIRKLVENIPDVATLRAWLAANPVEIAYILAEPIETDLTDDDLAAYKALHTYYPNSVIVNDAGAKMAVKYIADTKLYIDNKLSAVSGT